jgi:3-isopropylmalate/(R)-2-methylmalate dehydratase small subunit
VEPFRTLSGVAAALPMANLDTDQIMPKQFLRGVDRHTGLAEGFLHDLRFAAPGVPCPEFVLNRAPWTQAKILVTGPNYGCGSSREHAVWALRDYGFRAVVAPSFGDIFRQNCALNGVAPIVLAEREVRSLFDVAQLGVLTVAIDVLAGTLEAGPHRFAFQLSPRQQLLLTQDTDWIGATLAQRDRIAAFEAERLARQPWLARIFPS